MNEMAGNKASPPPLSVTDDRLRSCDDDNDRTSGGLGEPRSRETNQGDKQAESVASDLIVHDGSS